MVHFLIYLLLVLGGGIVAVNLLSTAFQFLLFLPFLLAGLWSIALHFRLKWGVHLTFVSTIALIAVAVSFIMPPSFAILSAVCILAAWDLSNFKFLLDRLPPSKKRREVETQHYKKLSAFILLALTFSLTAITVQLNLSFFTAVLLLVLAFIGLLQLFQRLSSH
jgi:hypothetical protein